MGGREMRFNSITYVQQNQRGEKLSAARRNQGLMFSLAHFSPGVA